MFNLFGSKKRVERLKKEVQDSFENVKEDISKVGDWIKHIDDKTVTYSSDLDKIKNDIEELKNSIEELKVGISFVNPLKNGLQTGIVQISAKKQTNSAVVQAAVQTAVQTGNLEQLTMMERAIVFILVNNDEKLSYEDIAVVLGKEKSTVRGQINSIKQKNPGLIEEVRELNGKKRLYINPKNKDLLLKTVKVRVKESKNS